MLSHSRQGFTLAELMITLALLGIIATFTVTKMLIVQQNQKKKAIFKETVSTISGILDAGLKDGQLTTYTEKDYMFAHLNAVKICDTNAGTQGCWNTTLQGSSSGEEAQAGAILHNGATIAGFANPGAGWYDDGLYIDWNGTAAPNLEGDDQLRIDICFGPSSCGSTMIGTGPKAPGSIGPFWAASVADQQLYQTIFQ